MESLNIPVILGTTRKGRRSAHVARFVTGELSRRPGVVTELVDIASMPIRTDGAGEEIKDPAFAGKMENADGLVIVAPEYNHSFPGLLKHVLDTCLEEYIHKAVGIVGVSVGVFVGSRSNPWSAAEAVAAARMSVIRVVSSRPKKVLVG